MIPPDYELESKVKIQLTCILLTVLWTAGDGKCMSARFPNIFPRTLSLFPMDRVARQKSILHLPYHDRISRVHPASIANSSNFAKSALTTSFILCEHVGTLGTLTPPPWPAAAAVQPAPRRRRCRRRRGLPRALGRPRRPRPLPVGHGGRPRGVRRGHAAGRGPARRVHAALLRRAARLAAVAAAAAGRRAGGGGGRPTVRGVLLGRRRAACEGMGDEEARRGKKGSGREGMGGEVQGAEGG